MQVLITLCHNKIGKALIVLSVDKRINWREISHMGSNKCPIGLNRIRSVARQCIALSCYFYVFFEERNIKDKKFIDHGLKNIEIFKKLI